MKRKIERAALILAVAVVFTCVGAYAASTAGTQSDPLVTLSYLNKTLQPSMETEFNNTVTTAMTQLERQFESEVSGEFAVVTLQSGKTMKCSAGCEVLFRSGSAAVVGSSGMIDISSGSTVASGKGMTANHLYMAPASDSGLKASGSVTLLVRGTYTIG